MYLVDIIQHTLYVENCLSLLVKTVATGGYYKTRIAHSNHAAGGVYWNSRHPIRGLRYILGPCFRAISPCRMHCVHCCTAGHNTFFFFAAGLKLEQAQKRNKTLRDGQADERTVLRALNKDNCGLEQLTLTNLKVEARIQTRREMVTGKKPDMCKVQSKLFLCSQNYNSRNSTVLMGVPRMEEAHNSVEGMICSLRRSSHRQCWPSKAHATVRSFCGIRCRKASGTLSRCACGFYNNSLRSKALREPLRARSAPSRLVPEAPPAGWTAGNSRFPAVTSGAPAVPQRVRQST